MEHEGEWIVYASGAALPHLAAVGRSRLVYRITGVPGDLVRGECHGYSLTIQVRDPDPGHPLKDSPHPLEYME